MIFSRVERSASPRLLPSTYSEEIAICRRTFAKCLDVKAIRVIQKRYTIRTRSVLARMHSGRHFPPMHAAKMRLQNGRSVDIFNRCTLSDPRGKNASVVFNWRGAESVLGKIPASLKIKRPTVDDYDDWLPIIKISLQPWFRNKTGKVQRQRSELVDLTSPPSCRRCYAISIFDEYVGQLCTFALHA